MWTSVRVKFFELVKLAFRYDSVIGDLSEHDGKTERLVEHHHIFLNNLGRPEAEIPAKSHQFYKGWNVRREKGVYDTVVYVLASVFHATKYVQDYVSQIQNAYG